MSILDDLQECYGNKLTLCHKEENGKVFIKIESSDTRAYIKAKQLLHNLSTNTVKKVLGGYDEAVTPTIELQTKMYIVFHKWSMTFKIYGLAINQLHVVEAIDKCLTWD